MHTDLLPDRSLAQQRQVRADVPGTRKGNNRELPTLVVLFHDAQRRERRRFNARSRLVPRRKGNCFARAFFRFAHEARAARARRVEHASDTRADDVPEVVPYEATSGVEFKGVSWK